MLVLLIFLSLVGTPPPRHAAPVKLVLPPFVSVAKPVKQPKPHNARQRKLIAKGCIKVALHEWVCPLRAP